ncbi:MAG: hypothetical protein ACM36C_08775 [Acidobacteriota bacterium]
MFPVLAGFGILIAQKAIESPYDRTILLTAAYRYLTQSERGARHVFDGIAVYLHQYGNLRWPALAKNTTELASALEDVANWRVAESALTVLCGAVLQIADMGLDACSTNESIPVACSGFTDPALARFCVGRDVHGLPLGAIVHFGRCRMGGTEQHTPECRTFMNGVFDHLLHLYYTDGVTDPAREPAAGAYRGQPIRTDALVLSTIGWTSYDRYLRDMRLMLRPSRSDRATRRVASGHVAAFPWRPAKRRIRA